MTDTPSLAYDDLGTGGTTLVLLHGIMADRSVFTGLLSDFPDRRVVNVDLRGYGQSPQADGYLTQDFVDDVARLLTGLQTGPVDLLGWSMGGAIGTVLAAQFPALLHRLVLVDTTPCLVQRPDWEPAIPPANAQGLGELLVRDWNAGAAAFAELVVSEPDQPEARTLVREAAERANPAVNLACFGTVGGEDRRGVLDAVSVPVDVICGTADLVCPPAASSYLAKVTAGSLTWIDGAGHAPFLTAREPFVAAVRSALS